MRFETDITRLVRELGTGASNATTGAQLAKWLGLRSSGSVRLIVNEACSQGIPICSNQDGYFLPWTDADIHETLAHRRSRVAKQNQAIAGLERALGVGA